MHFRATNQPQRKRHNSRLYEMPMKVLEMRPNANNKKKYDQRTVSLRKCIYRMCARANLIHITNVQLDLPKEAHARQPLRMVARNLREKYNLNTFS